MATETTNLHLVKQASTETYDYEVTNGNLDILDMEVSSRAKTVNEVEADEDGNIKLDIVPLAENLASNIMQESSGTFIERPSGGDASIPEEGNAWLTNMKGKHVHNGYVPQNVSMSVIPMPRTAPATISAVLDEETFIAYVADAGTYTLTFNTTWSEDPTLYGVTVSNTPIDGDSISITWDGENTPVMTINAVPRVVPPAITATINKASFIAAISGDSGTKDFTYTTSWSDNPASYGITVSNDPIAGDQISVTWQKEIRGTIIQSTPTNLISTGWNLYDHSVGYAKVVKYSNVDCFGISGTYSALKFSATYSGEKESIVPDEDGLFDIPSDGYVWVTDGNNTDTAIWMTWTNWYDGYPGSFERYKETVVDFSSLMNSFFTNGLLEVGNYQDEINFNTGIATSRVVRYPYDPSTINGIIASAITNHQDYEYDEYYVYLSRIVPLTYIFDINNEYTASDHGMERYTGTSCAVETKSVYGQNLKDKLRRECVTYGMTVSELKGMGS